MSGDSVNTAAETNWQRPNVEAPLIVWEYVAAVERIADKRQAEVERLQADNKELRDENVAEVEAWDSEYAALRAERDGAQAALGAIGLAQSQRLQRLREALERIAGMELWTPGDSLGAAIAIARAALAAAGGEETPTE